MARVVVVGGGISGLAAALWLVDQDPALEVQVFEASDRVGGLLHTEHENGLVIERGPDSILNELPVVLELAKRIGLEEHIVQTNAEHRGAYVVHGGKLEKIPSGFTVLGTSKLETLRASPLLSKCGKFRASLEPYIPKRLSKNDESVAAFVRRRYGRELLERLAQPMASGIYGGSAEALSLHATLPRFANLERESGSVTRGLRRQEQERADQAAQGARYGMFISFDQGLGMLPEAIAHALGDRVRLHTEVKRVRGIEGDWVLELASGEGVLADAVILALPSYKAAELCTHFGDDMAASLAEQSFSPAAIASFVWPRAAIGHPLDAFGFVVPEVENREILASTWSSVKWPKRAPEGKVLVRAFLSEQAITKASDSNKLIAIAERELASLMDVTAAPELTRIDSWSRAMPRYAVGHLQWLEKLEERLQRYRGLELTGNSYYGVGIPATIDAAQRIAARVVAAL